MLLDRKLEVFFAVVDAGSITKAAEKVGLTQPALSKIIQRLEADYDTKLFERGRRGARLTDDGQTLFNHAQNASAEFLYASEEIAARHSRNQTELKLHCGQVYVLDWIHEPLKILADMHPDVNFKIESASFRNTVQRLLKGEFDAVLGYAGEWVNDPRLEYTPLHNVETSVFARKDNPLHSGPPSLKQLAQNDWCEFTEVFRTNEHFQNIFSATPTLSPRIRFSTNSLSFAMKVVAQTNALMCLPSPLTKYARQFGLYPIVLNEKIWTHQTGCITRKSSMQYGLVCTLVELIKEHRDNTGEI